MSASLCRLVDDTFGPSVGRCRGGFDFTLLFEESILSLLPLVLLLGIVPLRILYLFKRSLKVTGRALLLSKLVCTNVEILIEEEAQAEPRPRRSFT